jgi:hypothetical protein
VKKITRLLAQDERRPKPRITLSRPTTADDVASPAPVVTAAPKRENDKEKAPLPTWTDHDRLFEALAIAEIDRLPTRVWATMEGLWLHLPSVPPSMQKRLLMHMIEEAARRGDPLPPKFVRRFAPYMAQFLAVPEARDRIHDIEGLRAAAQCQAKNPNASLNDLAHAAGLTTKHAKQVVRGWKQSAEFKRWVREFRLRPRRGEGHSPAYDKLMAIAAAWRKEFPELTVAQIFAEIYTNPAAFGCSDLVSHDQDFEKSRLEKPPKACVKRSV